ncbi:hypothetical protein AMJ40_05810 [candidate division TA06 bacterium DG_26]|uniref:FAD:protein FMN transferase n=1 Tax=candidate division TA06 bacterium DG_26 TaxID=1703771 RepID=A0A0S7WGP5_UNCT6|nr:MAG: hypothetical protein AMJ40_05810 [candidate division TA06 bacterium DG_26]
MFCALLCTKCARELQQFEQKRILLGTTVEIRLLDTDRTRADEAIKEAFLEIEKVNSLMSLYDGRSELSSLNALGYSRHEDLIRIIRECRRWGDVTEGAFDITVAPLVRLWDFRNGKIPEEDELRDALRFVDYRKISIDSIVRIPPGCAIDLGGVAKGYAVDRALERLKELGIRHALVDAGGDIRTMGGKGNSLWKIGVKHPRREGIMRTIELGDGSVATSGDYERYFFRDSVRYHHILDPRTGYPAVGCVSATILAEKAMDADVLATAIMVLGPQTGIKLIESLDGTGALIIHQSPRGLIVDEVGTFGSARGKILEN